MKECSLCYEKKILIKKCNFDNHMICKTCDTKYKNTYPNREGCVFCNPSPNTTSENMNVIDRHNYYRFSLVYLDNNSTDEQLSLIEPIIRRQIFLRRNTRALNYFLYRITKSAFIFLLYRNLYIILFGIDKYSQYDYNFTILPLIFSIIL